MGEAKRFVPVVAIGILTFHPDNLYWIIVNAQRKAVMAKDRELLVFSNEVVAHTFILRDTKLKPHEYVLEQLYWDNLVDRFCGQFSYALIDYRGRLGPKSRIPLKKEILYPC